MIERWDVISVINDSPPAKSCLDEGWEPFAWENGLLILRRKRQPPKASSAKPTHGPTLVCSACGEKLGHGHADSCPRTPVAA